LAAALGGYKLLSEVPGRLLGDRVAEDVHRNSAWSPIYGFADVCQSNLGPRSTVLLVDPTGAPAEIPVSQRTGAAAVGLPGDLDWPNQAVFAYVLYPRSVSAVGHVPSDWNSTGSAGYVALWRQGSYRSPEATAAAQEAEVALRKSPGAQEICAYSSAGGDHGVIFRTPGADAQAATGSGHAPPALPGGRLAAYARVLVGLASLWLVGFLTIRLLAGSALPPLLSSAVALPLGCLDATLELLAYSALGAGWSGPSLAAPWLLLGAVVLWRDRVAGLNWMRKLSTRTAVEVWRVLGVGEKLALAVLAGVGLVTLTAPLGLPWSDGFSLYYFKAMAFFTDGSVVPFYHHASGMLFSFPAHPPLVPLSVTWLYLFLGEVDEHASLLLWPAFYFSMLGGFYALVRTTLARSAALWYTAALALVGYELSTQAMLASFADLPLAVFLLLACGLFCFWVRTERTRIGVLAVAGLLLGAAALTKEEGLPAALVIIAATPLLMRSLTTRWSRSWLVPGAVALPVVAVIAGSWLWLRTHYNLPEQTVHLGGGVSVMLHRLPPAMIGLGARAALPLLPFVALAAVVWLMRGQLDWRRLLNGPFWFLLAVVIVQLGVDLAAIAAAPVEVHHQVAIAGGRLVSQVLPLVFLAFAEVWVVVMERARIPALSFGEVSRVATAPIPSGAKGA
jgi:hypothetical protein